jgi:hypothetical protein
VSDFVQSLADVIPSHLRNEVERELRMGFNVMRVKAVAEAKQTAVFHNANEARSIDGVGEKLGSIPGDAYHYWGQRLGYECWDDDQFVREFFRDNPETAVRNRVKRAVSNGAIFTADGHLIP